MGASPLPSGMSVLWLLLVLALVPTVLWLLKRSGLIAGLPAGRRGAPVGLRLVDTLALAPGQRLMRVELRRPDGSLHHLVLGQGSGGVHLITQYALDDSSTAAPDFQEALATVQRETPA